MNADTTPWWQEEGQVLIDYEKAARFLFDLLDDIDTAGDRAKGDNETYRIIVERLHRRRFEVATTDGYSVTFKERKHPAQEEG